MTLLERIKTLVFGKDVPPPVFDDTEIDAHRTAGRPSVSTPADDPVMDDIAAAGTQPVSKPREIEAVQNPPRTSPPLRN